MEKEIRERALNIMKERNISYGELSKRTNLSKSTLQRYLTKESVKVPIDRLSTIAQALETTPAYLLGWSDSLLEYVVDEDKDIVKHFMKYQPYPDDMNEEEMSIKKLLNTFGYDLSCSKGDYYILDDFGAYTITNDELKILISETKKYLQFNVDKISKEKRDEMMKKLNKKNKNGGN